MRTRVLAAAALPGLLAICCAAGAAEPVQVETTTVVYGGVKVAIDSVTGKLRPMSNAESAALDRVVMGTQAAASRTANPRLVKPATVAAALQTRRAVSGGGKAMKMPMSEMSHVIAVRDAAGNVTVQHGEDGSVIGNAVAPNAAEDVK